MMTIVGGKIVFETGYLEGILVRAGGRGMTTASESAKERLTIPELWRLLTPLVIPDALAAHLSVRTVILAFRSMTARSKVERPCNRRRRLLPYSKELAQGHRIGRR